MVNCQDISRHLMCGSTIAQLYNSTKQRHDRPIDMQDGQTTFFTWVTKMKDLSLLNVNVLFIPFLMVQFFHELFHSLYQCKMSTVTKLLYENGLQNLGNCFSKQDLQSNLSSGSCSTWLNMFCCYSSGLVMGLFH